MDTDRMRSLLEEALSLLSTPNNAPKEPDREELSQEDTIQGKVGRPDYKERQGIALWEAGLKVPDGNGSTKWINVQAWRKTAIYARANCPSAEEVVAVGRWKHEQWIGDDGVGRERDVFVISHFKPIYEAH